MRVTSAKQLAILIAAACVSALAQPPAARRQFEAGQYAEAVKTLQVAIAADANNAALHFWLARSFFELRDFDRAVASAERAVSLDSKNSEYRQWLGRAYGRKAELAGWLSGFSLARKTRAEFEEAVRLNPANFSAQHDLIEFYLQAPGVVGGGKDKGRRQAEALAALDLVEGHVAMAAYWQKEKRHDLAEAEYRKVLAARPNRLEPYMDVAGYYAKRGDPARIEEAIEAAARVNANDPRLDYHRAVANVLAGLRLEDAERMLAAYLKDVPSRSDYPSHAAAREWLGRLYERQGKRAEAAAQYRAALQLHPDRRSAREALGRLGERP